MPDFSSFTIDNGIVVLVLVLSITQAVKEMLALSGRAAKLLTFIVAIVIGAVAVALNEGFFPDAWTPYVNAGFFVLAFALSAIGAYDFTTKKLPSSFGR